MARYNTRSQFWRKVPSKNQSPDQNVFGCSASQEDLRKQVVEEASFLNNSITEDEGEESSGSSFKSKFDESRSVETLHF
ncbi:hypothetical protein V6N13_053323 [Hibiscus sabdariffa]|uniref:Uncharacterized protein n=1 Tax=Hibiscus sabdariffa TaxID=183260 RepID=A0ABR2A1Q7_9ROSI